jgi:hypothetical protein
MTAAPTATVATSDCGCGGTDNDDPNVDGLDRLFATGL